MILDRVYPNFGEKPMGNGKRLAISCQRSVIISCFFSVISLLARLSRGPPTRPLKRSKDGNGAQAGVPFKGLTVRY
jgi:hypothetical protein